MSGICWMHEKPEPCELCEARFAEARAISEMNDREVGLLAAREKLSEKIRSILIETDESCGCCGTTDINEALRRIMEAIR